MKRLRLKTIIACILLGLLITASGLVLFWHGTFVPSLNFEFSKETVTAHPGGTAAAIIHPPLIPYYNWRNIKCKMLFSEYEHIV